MISELHDARRCVISAFGSPGNIVRYGHTDASIHLQRVALANIEQSQARCGALFDEKACRFKISDEGAACS
jgi:hypothetical protein